ncbi:MAG: cysteine desulfurase family protein [Oscillospiraceae bacterium]|nr:cysteine desulfurase family protein [Oscillospiraceae bacterium]
MGSVILMQYVYLDNSATTKPCELSVKYTLDALENFWGNPSSLHMLGVLAEEKINEAKKCIADVLHCKEEEIVFTSGGTEANNTAIISAALKGKKRGNRIVTTEIEHPSVLETVKRLEEEGFEVVKLKPDKNGVIPAESIKNAITKDTILVSIMLVNNETGAIQPVETAAAAIKSVGAPALLHVDAVQAFGKMPINPSKLGVDLLTVSGHKIHASKGIGFLYIRKGVTIKPYITGGGQEKGMRSGTEPVPLIYGLLGAVKSLPNLENALKKQKELWNYAKQKLSDTGFVKINSSDECLPYIINISVPGYRSETLLHFLENEGIYVSSGSACAKGEGSYVLKSCGFDRKTIDSSLRISFSRDNTKEDIDALVSTLIKATERLQRSKI